ncbi:DNA-processing protein DprA [Micavibrio aeruginosavorus]|uniref:Rossmann fold nucleotide-binding protein Smf possibly involved in DNA uptake n=1 Tax=Micavibrio aeruginosavorus EPB TaxID=349215 RepID=M4VH02_9BACT|nr:DNA-processing protein DprA [Micavibrio aeruginosavorus]AGH98657.1 Rossmann fold nucleotide-binding protein Smf possibly involved in DNA uptake [Micavibrio aeruginosavorus EPB]
MARIHEHAATSHFDDDMIRDWLRLARTPHVGPITFYRLLQKFGTARAALDALPDLAQTSGKHKKITPAPLADIDHELNALRKIGGQILCADDVRYPAPLRAVEDAPPIITVLGNIELLKRRCVGIVGARNASMNGRNFARKLAADLSATGIGVVSGLARGIDTAAHEGSLSGGTIAVVAGGIDIVYPPENQKLYDSIRAEGLIVAESPLAQEPFAQSFPRRNRVISGLSQGVVVVEASLRSGSLITARVAAEQGRDVFAVPGHPMDPRAEGTNSLIRDGAVMVRSAQDILDDLRTLQPDEFHTAAGVIPGGLFDRATGFVHDTKTSNPDDDVFADLDDDILDMMLDLGVRPVPTNPADLCEAILDHLSTTAVDVDDLIRTLGQPTAAVQSALLTLELSGRVQRLPGNRVVRLAA